MGVPLLRGRAFDGRDAGRRAEPRDRQPDAGATSTSRARIRSAKASRHLERRGTDEIVGVVGDVRQLDLDTEARATIYWPHARIHLSASMTVAIRTAGDPRGVVAARRRGAARAGSERRGRRCQDDGGRRIDISVAQRRLTMLLLAIFAGAGAGAGGCRHLRRDRLQRVAAHAGDRHPHGARRAATATCCGWSSARR